jgi:DNA gyrase subunit A
MVADEEQVLVLTAGGYVKRTNPEEFRKQKRGGVGVIDLDTKEEDFVTTFLRTSTHSDLLFFTDVGKAYQLKFYEIPEGKRSTKGRPVVNFLSLTDAEKVTSVLPMRKNQKEGEKFLYMITKQGVAKKVDATAFHDVRRSGLIAQKLQKGDELIAALLVEKGDEIFLSTSKGQSIRFKESDIRAMGRAAGGVRGMKLSGGDFIVGADVVKKSVKDQEVLVVSRNGYGKTTPIDDYKTQNRGGSGIKTMNMTPKTGPVIAARIVVKTEGVEEGEMVVISKKGQVIRTGINEIPSLSRSTQGVRVMKLRDGDAIASFVCL